MSETKSEKNVALDMTLGACMALMHYAGLDTLLDAGLIVRDDGSKRRNLTPHGARIVKQVKAIITEIYKSGIETPDQPGKP